MAMKTTVNGKSAVKQIGTWPQPSALPSGRKDLRRDAFGKSAVKHSGM